MLIAVDIGGTRSDQAIYPADSEPHAPLAESQIQSSECPTFQALVLGRVKISVGAAYFDVAGPVLDGHAKIADLPPVVDKGSVASDLRPGAVQVMNELEAVAPASDLITINEENAVANGPTAAIRWATPGFWVRMKEFRCDPKRGSRSRHPRIVREPSLL